MDRNRFLTLAMRYANGEMMKVKCDGIEYYPISYTIKPESGGTYSHTVLLKDTKAASSYTNAPLEGVEEIS